ncbi:MAG: Glycosyl transferase, group 1 family protein [Candidatus Kuenenbacteria bacterium GW2011_GWA2_42_15]|uniref:Glycosyl transferase, group 1 family protein n=3 Tax=Candidatus Kueneniibacteriota TaxID=1752740 RepID=A0A0G0Z1T1_9BACT|nr:MAG: Glycosyl transferase, group 1 family protein [Candidatus Kuenenbacteria bacterium GW2011_GWA2_42_15]
MKILILTSRFGFGYGMGYSAYKEAIALTLLGHSVTVVHCYSDPEIADFYDSRIKLIYLPMSKLPLVGFFTYFFKLNKAINEKIEIEDFDIVYIQSLEFGLLALARIKIPIFYYARSTIRGMRLAFQGKEVKTSFLSKITNLILITLECRCIRYSKMIFVKSYRMAREVCDLYGVGPKKLVVITGGIDDKDFQIQSELSCIEFKRKLKIPSDIPIVLYAGRIVPQKGLSYLVEASLKLLQEMNFVVIIAGANANEPYYAKVKHLIDNSIYRNSFYFLGHINQLDMSLVLNLADCLVTPSFYEPFGMINLQAAFLNKKIITTEVTGSVDLLANYEKIKIVRAGSSTAIELAMREVLLLKSPTNQLPIDLSDYSWRSVAEQLLRYFSLTDII